MIHYCKCLTTSTPTRLTRPWVVGLALTWIKFERQCRRRAERAGIGSVVNANAKYAFATYNCRLSARLNMVCPGAKPFARDAGVSVKCVIIILQLRAARACQLKLVTFSMLYYI